MATFFKKFATLPSLHEKAASVGGGKDDMTGSAYSHQELKERAEMLTNLSARLGIPLDADGSALVEAAQKLTDAFMDHNLLGLESSIPSVSRR